MKYGEVSLGASPFYCAGKPKEMKMLRAKDVMNADVISVKQDTPIIEAVELIVKNAISGLPVVRGDMTLAGVLSEKDLVVLFYENKDLENKTVRDYMTQPAVHFDENEALLEVCYFLVKNIFRRVPITSEGKLIGIISVKDVLESTLKTIREKAAAC